MNFLVLLFASVLAILASAAPSLLVQLDPWGDNAVRIRVAPPGGVIVEPPFSPLLVPHPKQQPAPSSPLSITNGNIIVNADSTTGFVTAMRVSDGVTLFKTTALSFGPASPGSHANSVSANMSYVLGGASNKQYGLGACGAWLCDTSLLFVTAAFHFSLLTSRRRTPHGRA